MEPVPVVVFIAIFVVIVCASVLAASRETVSRRVSCPGDGEEKVVVLQASVMEPEHWARIVECGRPGEGTTSGRRLTCNGECLPVRCGPAMRRRA